MRLAILADIHGNIPALETALPRFVEFAYRQAAEAGYADSPFVPDDIWEKSNELFKIKLAKGIQ